MKAFDQRMKAPWLRCTYLVLPAHVVEDWQRLQFLGNAAGLGRGSRVVMLVQGQNLWTIKHDGNTRTQRTEFHNWNYTYRYLLVEQSLYMFRLFIYIFPCLSVCWLICSFTQTTTEQMGRVPSRENREKKSGIFKGLKSMSLCNTVQFNRLLFTVVLLSDVLEAIPLWREKSSTKSTLLALRSVFCSCTLRHYTWEYLFSAFQM